jgi:predicted nucleotidyltransferase component of viral defense system
VTDRHGDEIEPSVLTAFQVEVARLFFSLPASDRFLLAGGAALLAQHMTVRPTHDLDFFTGTPGSVESVRDEFEVAAKERGWSVDVRQSTAAFCRLVVHSSEDLLVDIALDSPPLQPASASFLGPTFAPEELAGRKLLALFDRAAARDFADVFVLLQTYTKSQLLTWANDIDAGFDRDVLVEQLGTLRRFPDGDLPVESASAEQLREFFAEWGHELAS